jgi:nucleoside-triphosphatase THEP1
MLPPRVLVTGPPGVGKTTLVLHVIDLLRPMRLTCFFTEEVRGRAGRTGFQLVTLDGHRAQLATAGGEGGPRVGRYRVHLAALEAVCEGALEPRPGVDAVVIDEIGKMECLSPAFVQAARRALTGPVPVLATVALAGGGFIGEAKRLPGAEMISLSRENRDRLPAEISARLAGGRRDVESSGGPHGLRPASTLVKVISGGQTGVDRAALLAALARGLECGGWCPPGRDSEAGPIPDDLPLKETPQERSPDAPHVPRSQRTEWNVRDSEATLLLRPGRTSPTSPGTDWTSRCARRSGRPILVCDPADPDAPSRIRAWLCALRVRTLNVAGPSEAEQPGIEEAARQLLLEVFG